MEGVQGWTPLRIAAACHDAEAAKSLLRRGLADPANYPARLLEHAALMLPPWAATPAAAGDGVGGRGSPSDGGGGPNNASYYIYSQPRVPTLNVDGIGGLTDYAGEDVNDYDHDRNHDRDRDAWSAVDQHLRKVPVGANTNEPAAVAASMLGLRVATLQQISDAGRKQRQLEGGVAAEMMFDAREAVIMMSHREAARATALFFRTVSGGWTPTTQHMYPKSAKRAVMTVMLVQQRLCLATPSLAAAAAVTAGDGDERAAAAAAAAAKANEMAAAPVLASILHKLNLAELWIRCILKFLMFEGWPKE